MAKPYEWDRRLKGYKIKEAFSLKYPVGAGRPTKNAAGLAYTRARSGHGAKMFNPLDISFKALHQQEVNTLSVRGTLDTLRRKAYSTERIPCTSCGCNCKGKLRLKK